ncbi:hypothetical protein BN126_2058 [Cronobacter sakazakii 680]|nr:hypothetical protein BN126_2058 [Cronobacter sakazakii 680]
MQYRAPVAEKPARVSPDALSSLTSDACVSGVFVRKRCLD